jgi:hypothetical protein
MSNTVGNVIQGKPVTTGGVLLGTSGATLPTDANASLTGFTALGFVGDAGLTASEAATTDKIKAWGGQVVKVVQSEFSVTYTFTLYEMLNKDVQSAIRGSANVTSTAATSAHGKQLAVQVNADTKPKLPWVFDMVDGDAKKRIVVPLGQVTSIGDVSYTDSGVAGYPVTLEAFPDSSGNNAYEYTDDGVTA